MSAELRRARVEPQFDGDGDVEATYSVRDPGQPWHVFRVNANGVVIAMLNHLRERKSDCFAEFFRLQLGDMIEEGRTSSPRVSKDAEGFQSLNKPRLAWIARVTISLALQDQNWVLLPLDKVNSIESLIADYQGKLDEHVRSE